jgi:predicted Fe-Mo cluster-binding NifX family protein
MKLAVATVDEKTISSHFGQAPYYRVFTLIDHQVVQDETRQKPHHGQHEGHGQYHGQSSHEDMFAPISDCEVLLCGGMGEPAYQKAISAGLEVILTGGEINDALDAYLSNRLVSDMRRIHKH